MTDYDEVPSIYDDIKDLLFHSTSEDGLLGIIKDKEISPYNGTFSATWNVRAGATTYGLKHGYVCLFDFESCSAEQSLKYSRQWHNVVLAHKPFSYFIVIDREKIKDNLVKNETARVSKDSFIQFIPYVEAWSNTAVPLNTFKHLYVLQNFMRDSNYLIKKINFDKSLLKNLRVHKEKVISAYSDEYMLWEEEKRNRIRLEERLRKASDR